MFSILDLKLVQRRWKHEIHLKNIVLQIGEISYQSISGLNETFWFSIRPMTAFEQKLMHTACNISFSCSKLALVNNTFWSWKWIMVQNISIRMRKCKVLNPVFETGLYLTYPSSKMSSLWRHIRQQFNHIIIKLLWIWFWIFLDDKLILDHPYN